MSRYVVEPKHEESLVHRKFKEEGRRENVKTQKVNVVNQGKGIKVIKQVNSQRRKE